ncbi:MAG: hypothetical protein ACK5L3_08610 [Oscillospiraceae bacterium]
MWLLKNAPTLPISAAVNLENILEIEVKNRSIVAEMVNGQSTTLAKYETPQRAMEVFEGIFKDLNALGNKHIGAMRLPEE